MKEPDEQYTYKFTGWEPAISGVTGDATYKAVFEPVLRNYTITWQDDAGRTIDTATVAYGKEPAHADPVKEPDEQYTYRFTGWEPAISGVSGNATYKATFKPEPIVTLKPRWVCSNCGKENPDEDSFCTNCAAPREAGNRWTCSNCGKENPGGDSFCTNCAAPREAEKK